MSSSSFRRPDFRLHLSYPEVTLLRSDIPGMTRLAAPDHPAFTDDLRRLAAAIDAANGRLTVILPDREVWRDRPRLAARVPWARRGEARSIAAQALGVPPGDVALSMGRRGSDGTTPLAATRRQTLVEVRRMLAAVGLRPQVIRGAGRFDGFTTPPALGRLRWHPAGRPLPSRFPHAAMAAGSLAATIAAVVALLGSSGPGPTVSPGPLVHQSVARQAVTVAEAPPPAPAVRAPRPAATALANAAPPRDRPSAAPRDAGEPPLVTVNTRNVDLATGKDGQVVLKLHALPAARAAGPVSALDPMPRPGAVSEAASGPSTPRVVPLRSSRPLPRPLAEADPVEQIVKRVAAADTEDFGRPEHRPGAKPVELASLTPAIATFGALAAASAIEPLARPASLAPTPAPKVAAPTTQAPKPVAAKPAPKLQRGATATAVAARPVPQAVVRPVIAKPVVTASAAPQPKIVPITPTPKITRTAVAAKPATTRTPDRTTERTLAATAPRVGLSRSQLSLIGVFGDTDAPHALVRLPNGDIQRVRAGDRIAGLQVASVSTSGVRVRNGTSETVLRLPD